MLGVHAESVDPKTWTAIVKDWNYAGNLVEILVILSNNLNASIQQRFTIDSSNPNWKKDLETQVRNFILGDDTKKQTKLDIFSGLTLDLSDPIIVVVPPDETLAKFKADLNSLRKIERNPNINTGLVLADVANAVNSAISKNPSYLNLI